MLLQGSHYGAAPGQSAPAWLQARGICRVTCAGNYGDVHLLSTEAKSLMAETNSGVQSLLAIGYPAIGCREFQVLFSGQTQAAAVLLQRKGSSAWKHIKHPHLPAKHKACS